MTEAEIRNINLDNCFVLKRPDGQPAQMPKPGMGLIFPTWLDYHQFTFWKASEPLKYTTVTVSDGAMTATLQSGEQSN